jgi:hypothetical protein
MQEGANTATNREGTAEFTQKFAWQSRLSYWINKFVNTEIAGIAERCVDYLDYHGVTVLQNALDHETNLISAGRQFSLCMSFGLQC